MDAEGQRLLTRLPDWFPARAQPAVLVTVWRVEGSTPRQPGARMLCRDGKLLAGTIGGGHLEDQALRDATLAAQDAEETRDVEDTGSQFATEMREDATPRDGVARLARYPLGPQLGQCCGGVVWLHYRPVDRDVAVRLSQEVEDAERFGTVFETRFAQETLQEWPDPLPTVLVCGAGHVAAALVRVLQPLPWRVLVVDQRPEWADPYRFAPTADVLCTEPMRLLAAWGWLGAEAQASQAAAKLTAHGRTLPRQPRPEATWALVMTHDHALDRDLTEALLGVGVRAGGKNRIAYVGLIGSQSKVRTTHQRLSQRGVPEAELARLVAPIGLRLANGQLLGGKLPGEIAISVAAQLLTLLPTTGS